MRAFNAIFAFIIRVLGFFLVRLDARGMAKIPRRGPFIVVMNHVNFLDGPLLLSRLFPRRVIALAKKETWNNPFLGFAAAAMGAIPVERGGADPAALRLASRILEGGGFLYINPEGTRRRDGVLGPGKPGVVAIALRTGAPIIPLAFEGLETFGSSIRRLRRTPATLHVGEAFSIERPEGMSDRDFREAALGEIMRRIAALLPESKRGQWGETNSEAWRLTRSLRESAPAME